MGQDWGDSDFEGFRRNRKRRRLEAGPKRDLGRRAGVLREIEATEAAEMANERMSREVHEFFSDATRTAAEIVARFTEEVESEHSQHITQEMLDFLHDAVNRAQDMIIELRSRGDVSTVGIAEMEANLQNILGHQLDEFRDAGTAQLGDKHIGQDPFAESTHRDEARDSDLLSSVGEAEPREIEEHLVAEVVETSDDTDVEDSADDVEIPAFLRRLAGDQKRLVATLKSLVATEAMTKDEALGVFHALAGQD
ncbi:MAG: hypothetical protein KDB80_16740 [Planctomycetes bacterium]|nr:hypothetical protein [Planctomycetota bacterium]